MAVLFIFVVSFVAVASPFLRRHGKAGSAVLAGGAVALVAIALVEMLHPDARAGLAANQADRRFYWIIFGCEVPVMALALISQRRFKKAFWVGWGIHMALAVWLTAVVTWLQFFWHW
jgi:hypothetical protein